jgi:hypothetical protein
MEPRDTNALADRQEGHCHQLSPAPSDGFPSFCVPSPALSRESEQRFDVRPATAAEHTSSCLPPPSVMIQVHDSSFWEPYAEPLRCLALIATYARPDHSLDTTLTPFHSKFVPPVALTSYGLRIAHHSGYGPEGLSVGLALMGRYAKATGSTPSAVTLHRLLATCVVVGMKATSDKFVKNVHMATVVGVPLAELNWLEISLLAVLQYAVTPRERELHELSQNVHTLTSNASPCHRPAALFHVLTRAAPNIVPFPGLSAPPLS